jgi:hypothetical protein
MPDSKRIVIDNVDKISMSYTHDTEKHETKRKVSLSLDIEDNQAREIEKAMALNAAWSVQLTVVSKQLPMEGAKPTGAE